MGSDAPPSRAGPSAPGSFRSPLAPKFKGLAGCRGASEQLQEAGAGQPAQTLAGSGPEGAACQMSAAGAVSERGAVTGTLQEEGSPKTGA